MSDNSTNTASIPTPTPKGNTLARPLNLSTKGLNNLAKPATIAIPTSAVFDIKHALNPLIAITSPVLMAVNNLNCEHYTGSLTLLYETFVKEIKTFEEKARKLEYRSAMILAARYFICTYIDEALTTQSSNIQKRWQKHPLLKNLQNENYGGERFFLILDRASDDPKGHLDLLELGFMTLNLGYKGKYKNPETDERELEHIRDNLYNIIKKYRGDFNSSLFITDANTHTTGKIIKKKKRIPHLYLAGGIFILGLFSVSISYQTHLRHLAKPLITKLNQLTTANSIKGGAINA